MIILQIVIVYVAFLLLLGLFASLKVGKSGDITEEDFKENIIDDFSEFANQLAKYMKYHYDVETKIYKFDERSLTRKLVFAYRGDKFTVYVNKELAKEKIEDIAYSISWSLGFN